MYIARHFLFFRSATAVDDLPVDLEGDTFPLREVASISKKDPKRVIIDCATFPQATKSIMTAILKSGMNLNPQQDGIRIYVPIPKVTKEYREQLAKGAKTRFFLQYKF
jgi:ribosome recycling factor